METNAVNVYDIEESEIKFTFAYHKSPIVGLVYHATDNYIVSLDVSGMFQYWHPQDGSSPKEHLQFIYPFVTDLMVLKKNQLKPLSLSMSRTGQWMGVFAGDWKVSKDDEMKIRCMCSIRLQGN